MVRPSGKIFGPRSCARFVHRLNMTAPTKSELLQMADDLLEAFTAPWKDLEPSALHFNDLVDSVVDRSPPTPLTLDR